MAKYVDPREVGLCKGAGYAAGGGKALFDRLGGGADVFLEVDYYDSVVGNFFSKKPHASSDGKAKWSWYELNEPDTIKRLGQSIIGEPRSNSDSQSGTTCLHSPSLCGASCWCGPPSL